MKKWTIQSCPINKGKHPLHDRCYITTGEFNHNGNCDGEIICKMTDSNHQAEHAHLIVTAPELLDVCRKVKEYFKWNSNPATSYMEQILDEAINNAKGSK